MTSSPPLDLNELALQVAQSIGSGQVSPQVSTQLRAGLPDVAHLSVGVKADVEGRLVAELGNLLEPGLKSLALLTPGDTSIPDTSGQGALPGSAPTTPIRIPIRDRSSTPEGAPAAPEATSGSISPIAFLQAHVTSSASVHEGTSSSVFLQALAEGLEGCLRPHSEKVMDSAFMFVMGRPRPAAQQPPPPAAEAAPSGGPSPTRLEAAESCFVQPVLASLKPRKAWDWDCYDSCSGSPLSQPFSSGRRQLEPCSPVCAPTAELDSRASPKGALSTSGFSRADNPPGSNTSSGSVGWSDWCIED